MCVCLLRKKEEKERGLSTSAFGCKDLTSLLFGQTKWQIFAYCIDTLSEQIFSHPKQFKKAGYQRITEADICYVSF